ncbi:3-hydroxyacyl-CoA dehydrogenase family protein [Roseomonas sp. BN140053]|uniref:3-hydroxyacyl-CoA dehydrogenase family protein n=1 Tax=Roseomonas sp. BN140053 TaxID=3391898 RepID=UPI0039EB35AD
MSAAPLPVTVIGAGLMGHGLAQVFAAGGHAVSVYDPAPNSLATLRDRIRGNLRDLGEDESAAERVTPVPNLAEAVRGAGFVVEAALEDLAVKQELFARIEAACPAETILASNTSVIPITRIMEGLRDRSRALGTHWWNPPFLVPLVEVIGTEWTAPAVVEQVIALHRGLGKVPVHVKRDVPGFVGNRLQHALWREAIALVEEGICDAETVDLVVKNSFGRRLGVLGPIENADLVGLDLTLAIHRTVLPAIDSRPEPSPLLEQLIAAGKLGMKSGEGLRRWTPEQQAALRRDMVETLKRARANDARGDTETQKDASHGDREPRAEG